MSNAIFPTLAGVTWDIEKSPEWATGVADATSGRQYTLARRLYPIWHFDLPFAVLRASGSWTEYQQLVGFHNARKGRSDDFLYFDPRDNTVAAQPFAFGDGVTRTFRLVRTLGGFPEPVGAVNTGSVIVQVAGVTTAVTFSADLSQVTFAAAPAAGAALTWSGQFYFRCRFENDKLSVKQFMQDMHSAASVKFKTFAA